MKPRTSVRIHSQAQEMRCRYTIGVYHASPLLPCSVLGTKGGQDHRSQVQTSIDQSQCQGTWVSLQGSVTGAQLLQATLPLSGKTAGPNQDLCTRFRVRDTSGQSCTELLGGVCARGASPEGEVPSWMQRASPGIVKYLVLSRGCHFLNPCHSSLSLGFEVCQERQESRRWSRVRSQSETEEPGWPRNRGARGWW